MYISEAPVTRPTAKNFTFFSISLGADTITVQAADPKKKCQPDPAIHKTCDLFIGIQGWAHTAVFTIVALTDSSFYNDSSTVELQEGRPQTGAVARGRYAYFQYQAPVSDLNIATLITLSVSFSL